MWRGLSVCRSDWWVLQKRMTDRAAVWDTESDGSKEPCFIGGGTPPISRGNKGAFWAAILGHIQSCRRSMYPTDTQHYSRPLANNTAATGTLAQKHVRWLLIEGWRSVSNGLMRWNWRARDASRDVAHLIAVRHSALCWRRLWPARHAVCAMGRVQAPEPEVASGLTTPSWPYVRRLFCFWCSTQSKRALQLYADALFLTLIHFVPKKWAPWTFCDSRRKPAPI